MAEFYKHFSEEEKDFIVKEFTSWQKMGLAVEEMIDDVVENVMELALSRELTADDVVTAYEEFINMEFTEVKEQKNGKKQIQGRFKDREKSGKYPTCLSYQRNSNRMYNAYNYLLVKEEQDEALKENYEEPYELDKRKEKRNIIGCRR